MDQLSWEQHTLRHDYLLQKAEANRLRSIALARLWRQRRDRALHLWQTLFNLLRKGHFGRYNQPSSSVQTHRTVHHFHSTNHL